MDLSPMRYKTYTWPHNPRVYSIDYERKMALHKTPFGLFHLQDLGRTNRIMEGEGEFVGEGAYAQFGQLANVFYDSGPGLLVHPLWQAANAYFVSLRLEQEPRPDYVRYSFSFWEDDSWYTGLAVSVTQGAGASEPEQDSSTAIQPVYHRVVKGDTLWAIANTYGIGLSELIALNPQIKNPNLIHVGDEVRVR
ncbi:LysM peptidoglycan-binding domain-containing protein [Flavonifractor sp. An100]|uniref:LysM peptidoglycan-binding domain-containing protein n=1 Tax=Flavonifractor sp. An100 TaxID=1965538 RepID=UPI001FA823D5|nr:LysM peptidoglycan-binding domain-containing protein [Flavonifractor sp. An100]